MLKLLIIADDFTGALDTAISFAISGAVIKVITPPLANLNKYYDNIEVLIIDTETRHLKAEEAFKIVKKIVNQAVNLKIPYIFKKTDSALRGNVGAELAAVLQAGKQKQLCFLPAFPQLGRYTIDGIQYIQGLPVSESVFGIDPFDPVCYSDVSELIKSQSNVNVYNFPAVKQDLKLPESKGIFIFDASTIEELEDTTRYLFKEGYLKLMAGCAGLANVLPNLLGYKKRKNYHVNVLNSKLTVISGSVNQITVKQLDYAEKKGFARISLSPEQRLTEGYWQTEAGKRTINNINNMVNQNENKIIDVNDGLELSKEKESFFNDVDDSKLRLNVMNSLGYIMHSLLSNPNTGTLLISGGDTLYACMKYIGISELEPLGELEPGVVLSNFNYSGRSYKVISKSGGFGEKDLLTRIAERMREDLQIRNLDGNK